MVYADRFPESLLIPLGANASSYSRFFAAVITIQMTAAFFLKARSASGLSHSPFTAGSVGSSPPRVTTARL